MIWAIFMHESINYQIWAEQLCRHENCIFGSNEGKLSLIPQFCLFRFQERASNNFHVFNYQIWVYQSTDISWSMIRHVLNYNQIWVQQWSMPPWLQFLYSFWSVHCPKDWNRFNWHFNFIRYCWAAIYLIIIYFMITCFCFRKKKFSEKAKTRELSAHFEFYYTTQCKENINKDLKRL